MKKQKNTIFWGACQFMAWALFAEGVHGAMEVRLANDVNRCMVRADRYQLHVDVTSQTPLVFTDPTGRRTFASVDGMSLVADGTEFLSDPTAGRAHLHTLRPGPHIVEFHIEGIVARAGDKIWPGLMELSVYCHPNRVYLVARYLCPNSSWIHRDTHVYQAPEAHRNSPPVRPKTAKLLVRLPQDRWKEQDGTLQAEKTPGLAWISTFPANASEVAFSAKDSALTWTPPEAVWESGSQRELGSVLFFAENAAALPPLLDVERHPLNAKQFQMQRGKFEGYDPCAGIYRITGESSPDQKPPRGYVGGSRFSVRNDARARQILIDQRDPWGGITGGVLRDEHGEPLPSCLQFFLNFSELNEVAKETGMAILTYPLELSPNENENLTAEHLYNAATDRGFLYLNSLENIGDPLLLQVTAMGGESYTQTTGRFSHMGQTHDNVLRINDFRRIYKKDATISAILPTFFGYYDTNGAFQGLIPGEMTFRETGPFLVEHETACSTADGAVAGKVRVWSAAHSDMTRIFCEVDLKVLSTVSLAARENRLFFLRYHAYNPMAYLRFAYTADDGKTKWGKMFGEGSVSTKIHVNGDPLGVHPLACLYWAQNALGNGDPCSKLTGNPGFVLQAWDVQFGGKRVSPGLFAFSTGANDKENGDYARDLAIVPTQPLQTIPAGSRIYYRCMQTVYGDEKSEYQSMEEERRAWAESPLALTAEVGNVLSSDPPEVRAKSGRAVVVLSGGKDWVPLRIRGLRPGKSLKITQTDSTGTRELGPGKPGEIWYNAWMDDVKGQVGFTTLIRTDPTGAAVKLNIQQ